MAKRGRTKPIFELGRLLICINVIRDPSSKIDRQLIFDRAIPFSFSLPSQPLSFTQSLLLAYVRTRICTRSTGEAKNTYDWNPRTCSPESVAHPVLHSPELHCMIGRAGVLVCVCVRAAPARQGSNWAAKRKKPRNEEGNRSARTLATTECSLSRDKYLYILVSCLSIILPRY